LAKSNLVLLEHLLDQSVANGIASINNATIKIFLKILKKNQFRTGAGTLHQFPKSAKSSKLNK
jgi:hypothetical protein